MLPVLLCLVAFFAQALGAISSGLYRISSNYFLLDVISQNGNSIVSDANEKATLEQLVSLRRPNQVHGAPHPLTPMWSVVVRGTSATIQNVGTLSFMSVDLSGPVGTVVPSAKPHNWTITPDATTSAATIHSCGKAVALAFELEPLQLFEPGPLAGANRQLWKFTPAVPQPRAYRVWNQAADLYLDQVPRKDCDSESGPEGCLVASAFNASSRSQVWKVAGTSACGGRPTLQNAATRDFLSSGADFDSYMGAVKPVPDTSPFAWSYGFVGGQLTILDRDGLDDVTTLGILGNQIVLYTTSTGPGTTPNQTWVFVPVP